MNIQFEPTNGACGARVSGIDLAKPLSSDTVKTLRDAWLEHHILVFPDQSLSDDDLETYSLYFGGFGHDPYIAPIENREHVIALSRMANETAPIFAESWHTDWSFQSVPPAATCLYSLTIPPQGGDTLFINQHKALAKMPDSLRQRLEGKMAIHSAAAGYAPDGLYGEGEKDSDRSMKILFSEDAKETQLHPVIRSHPETGEETLFGCAGYIQGFEGMEQDESRQLLLDLYHWQTRDEFQYRHQWSENMLVMWDNRSVLHKATSGYDGYDRLLHRTTIADKFAA